jgi:hypothetical protein
MPNTSTTRTRKPRVRPRPTPDELAVAVDRLALTETTLIQARDEHLAARSDLLDIMARLGVNGDSAMMML